MNKVESSTDTWIDRLASALPKLAEIQEPYLQEYQRQNPRDHHVFVNQEEIPPSFPLDDLRVLYAEAYHGNAFGKTEFYAPLRELLDPVRAIIRSHPTLERIVSPIIGKDEFWMEILNSGLSTSPADLVAGLMARAAELSGDRFRSAAEELNRLLSPVELAGTEVVPGELDVGFDAMLFYGLTFKEPIEISDGLVVLPFEQAHRFANEQMVNELAPLGAGYHGWESVGAVVRPFRWRPVFRRTGSFSDRALSNSRSFFKDALVFLDLLAVAHSTPVLFLATLTNGIDRSAGRLLGQSSQHGNLNRGRSAQSIDGFEKCPEPVPEALSEAKKAHRIRKGDRYAKVAWIVSRLSDALVNDGRFSDEDRIVTVAKTLERMYELPDRRISSKLQIRASSYLGGDFESRESIKKFYDTRSNIAHGWVENMSLESKLDMFDNGFDIARRTLFKLLHKGPPESWNNLSAEDT